MELFNLDDLVQVNRTVQLFGKTYDVADRTVGQMINAIKMASKSEQADPEEILGEMIETAHCIIPDCPIENIKRLNMNQLTALIEYASQPDSKFAEAREADKQQGKSE
ncbi:hypothetical protein ABXV18_24980 [Vibrio owensii]|uniref:hypothetical protein n=1 Tax=Vibrio owensii TaxID=696485 RepID=UPI0033949740